jgi:hypothetical protein
MAVVERHHSLVNMEISIARRVFLVLFLNTGLVLLAVNTRFPGAIWIGSGSHGDFDASWYSDVGTQIVLAMILNVFTPHFFPFVDLSLQRRRLRVHVAYSQRELNEMFLGPQFLLSFRLAQLVMTVFVIMLYSSGLPALYPIACATFFLQYWVDKYLLVNFYRSPPAYSDKLLKWASGELSWAVVGHLGFAIWMYSVPGVFWDGVSSGSATSVEIGSVLGLVAQESTFQIVQRLELDHIIPLYVFMFAIVLLRILAWAFHGVDALRAICCSAITCGVFDDGTIKRRFLNPNYSDALAHGEIRGLPNYNILENPSYARALGIDAQFAREHKHVSALRTWALSDPDVRLGCACRSRRCMRPARWTCQTSTECSGTRVQSGVARPAAADRRACVLKCAHIVAGRYEMPITPSPPPAFAHHSRPAWRPTQCSPQLAFRLLLPAPRARPAGRAPGRSRARR